MSFNTGEPLTAERTKKLWECLDSGNWKDKRLKGDFEGARSPCILLQKYHREDNVCGYQALWAMQKGPVPEDKTISHLCISEKRSSNVVEVYDDGTAKTYRLSINPCINVEHMRLEDIRTNLQRRNDQNRLLKLKMQWQINHSGYKGPLFLNHRNGEITDNADGQSDTASFTNCGVIKNVKGFYVHQMTQHLKSLWRRAKIKVYEPPQ